MIVGVLRADLQLAGVQSLKDKRRIVKSVLDRAQHQFRVAAAEVDHQQSRRQASLGFAYVSTEAAHAREVLARVVTLLERETEADLAGFSIELV